MAAGDEAQFRLPKFQKRLWEIDGVAGIGPGASVTVHGAYEDPEIVSAFWSLRNWEAPTDLRAYLDAEFEREAQFPAGEISFALVVTLDDSEGKKPIFQEMRQWLQSSAALAQDVSAATRLRPRG